MPTTDLLTPTVTVAHRARPGHPSQDRHLILPTAVAVLDGATNPDQPPGRDGGWYAEQLTLAIASRITNPARDLTGVLTAAIAEVTEAHQLMPGDSPSSTVTLLRWSDAAHLLEALVLADTVLVVRLLDGTVLIRCDERIDWFSKELQAGYRARLATGTGYDAKHRQLMADLRDHQATGRNRPGGFWVAEAEPSAAQEALTLDIDPGNLRDAAILSDGASAAVDTYGELPDWSTALNVMGEQGPSAVIAAARRAEAGDIRARRWPRAKVHDDATAVYLDFTQGHA